MCVLLPAAQDPALTRRLCTALAVILARAERTPECGTWIVYGALGRVANPGVSRPAYPQPPLVNATTPPPGRGDGVALSADASGVADALVDVVSDLVDLGVMLRRNDLLDRVGSAVEQLVADLLGPVALERFFDLVAILVEKLLALVDDVVDAHVVSPRSDGADRRRWAYFAD